MTKPGRPPGPAGACPWCGEMFHTADLVEHIKGAKCSKKPKYVRLTPKRERKNQMSFSWWCKDKAGKDLFTEFDINGQALDLDFDGSPNSCEAIRSEWAIFPYKDRTDYAARDAMIAVQSLVKENLEAIERPEHHECPSCTCRRVVQGFFYGPQTAHHMRRFVSIPLDRVWRAGGGR